MKHSSSPVMAAGLALLSFSPVHAASGVACTDFMAMDAAGQAAAARAMALPSDLSPLSDDSTAADALVALAKRVCTAHPDMMIDEAMDMIGS